LLLVVFAVIVIVRTVKIVPQQVSLIIERLGKFSRTLEGGLDFLVHPGHRAADGHHLA